MAAERFSAPRLLYFVMQIGEAFSLGNSSTYGKDTAHYLASVLISKSLKGDRGFNCQPPLPVACILEGMRVTRDSNSPSVNYIKD